MRSDDEERSKNAGEYASAARACCSMVCAAVLLPAPAAVSALAASARMLCCRCTSSAELSNMLLADAISVMEPAQVTLPAGPAASSVAVPVLRPIASLHALGWHTSELTAATAVEMRPKSHSTQAAAAVALE